MAMKKSGKKLDDPSPATPPKIPKKIKDRLKPYVQQLLSNCSDLKLLSKKVDWSELIDFYELTGKIIQLEEPYTIAMPKREDNLDNFLSWCTENHATFDLVTFKEIEEGNFGAVAKTEIKENEDFLTIPRRMIMSEMSAKNSKLGPLIESDPILENMPNVKIAMHLIVEVLNPSSFWKPYISMLPSNFNTVLYFSRIELKELQGSPVLDEVIKLMYSVARQYCYFFQIFQTNSLARSLNIGPYFTYELYRWAVSVVMTRQNFIPSPNGHETQTCLVPLFDLCNHKNGRLSTDFDPDIDSLISYACEPFMKGEEVHTFYGTRTNGDFFVHNAFVYPDNVNDAVEIKLGLGKSDPLLSLKKDLASKLKFHLNRPFFIHTGPNLSKELLTFLKINVMKADELENALNDEDTKLENFPDLEKRALSFLRDRIFLLLKCYKTTLEEDEELLKSGVFETHNIYLAVQLRMCEKRILNEAYEYCVDKCS